MTQTAETSFSNTVTTDEIKITPAAGKKLVELIRDADDGVDGIRVFVSGGGCDGMQYGLTFTENATEYDSVLEGEGYKLYIDAVALAYMSGCELDFNEKGANSSFIFNNVFQAVDGSGGCSGCGGGGF